MYYLDKVRQRINTFYGNFRGAFNFNYDLVFAGNLDYVSNKEETRLFGGLANILFMGRQKGKDPKAKEGGNWVKRGDSSSVSKRVQGKRSGKRRKGERRVHVNKYAKDSKVD